MKIVFFGNTKYSLIVAKTLFERFDPAAVVTIPDSPIETFAKLNNIPVIESRRLVYGDIKKIKSFSPDFLVVADYGLLLPKKLLDVPKYAPLNVHHSLLPKYRGPSPAPAAILQGEKITGVTIILMNEQLDAGDILAQQKYTIKLDETTEILLTKLNTIGGEIIISVINDYIVGKAKPIKQNESKVTFTKHITKQDGFIDINNPPSPKKLDCMIRAYYPWPTVWTKTRIMNKELRIMLLPNKMIQVEGKKPMSYKDFINGYQESLEASVKKLLLSLQSS